MNSNLHLTKWMYKTTFNKNVKLFEIFCEKIYFHQNFKVTLHPVLVNKFLGWHVFQAFFWPHAKVYLGAGQTCMMCFFEKIQWRAKNRWLFSQKNTIIDVLSRSWTHLSYEKLFLETSLNGSICYFLKSHDSALIFS